MPTTHTPTELQALRDAAFAADQEWLDAISVADAAKTRAERARQAYLAAYLAATGPPCSLCHTAPGAGRLGAEWHCAKCGEGL